MTLAYDIRISFVPSGRKVEKDLYFGFPAHRLFAVGLFDIVFDKFFLFDIKL